mmetsp:Transcript_15419/g.22656  ORF Transcript_15419/g.22656 Transcript_15419/m.22656 type:complete len:113 (+) Transcript_15419:1496-1834(+)
MFGFAESMIKWTKALWITNVTPWSMPLIDASTHHLVFASVRKWIARRNPEASTARGREGCLLLLLGKVRSVLPEEESSIPESQHQQREWFAERVQTMLRPGRKEATTLASKR